MLSHMVIARAQFAAERVNLAQAAERSCAVQRLLHTISERCSRASHAALSMAKAASQRWTATGGQHQR